MSRIRLALSVTALSLLSLCADAATVWLAGDSTAASRVGSRYVGWGTELQEYLTIPVQNMAIAGKSLRTYTKDGHFERLLDVVERDDIVIIQFGHFEGGGLHGPTRNSVLCPGLDPMATCESDDGEVFHTFFKYMEDAAKAFKDAGTHVIIASQTPANPFRDRTGATPVYALYAKAVAEKTGVAFLDHFSLTRDEYLRLGAAVVNSMLPSDGIHTTLAGAEIVANSFVRGVLCSGLLNPLYPYVAVDARIDMLRRKGGIICSSPLSLNP